MIVRLVRSCNILIGNKFESSSVHLYLDLIYGLMVEGINSIRTLTLEEKNEILIFQLCRVYSQFHTIRKNYQIFVEKKIVQ